MRLRVCSNPRGVGWVRLRVCSNPRGVEIRRGRHHVGSRRPGTPSRSAGRSGRRRPSSPSSTRAYGIAGRAVPRAGDLHRSVPQVAADPLHRLDLSRRPAAERRQLRAGAAVVDVDVVVVLGVVEIGQHVREVLVRRGRDRPVRPAGGPSAQRRTSRATGRSGLRRRYDRRAAAGRGRTLGRRRARTSRWCRRRSRCRTSTAGRNGQAGRSRRSVSQAASWSAKPGSAAKAVRRCGHLVDQRQVGEPGGSWSVTNGPRSGAVPGSPWVLAARAGAPSSPPVRPL